MRVKFYAVQANAEEIQSFPDNTPLDELKNHYLEWLEQVADAGFEIVEPNPGEPIPLALEQQEKESHFDNDVPGYLLGTSTTEDNDKDYWAGEIAW